MDWKFKQFSGHVRNRNPPVISSAEPKVYLNYLNKPCLLQCVYNWICLIPKYHTPSSLSCLSEHCVSMAMLQAAPFHPLLQLHLHSSANLWHSPLLLQPCGQPSVRRDRKTCNESQTTSTHQNTFWQVSTATGLTTRPISEKHSPRENSNKLKPHIVLNHTYFVMHVSYHFIIIHRDSWV